MKIEREEGFGSSKNLNAVRFFNEDESRKIILDIKSINELI